ncbi:MAG: tetratricopeptide repeat protein [Thermoanaerobaculia bacterium]
MKGKLCASLIALSLAASAAGEGAWLSAPEVEEASSVAVHTANALARGRSLLLREVVDELSLVGSAVGPSFLSGLTARQNRQISDRLVVAMAAPFTTTRNPKAVVRVLAASGREGQATVSLLMPSASGDLKSDWKLRLRHGEWRLEDIVLSDTSRSIRQEAIDSLGPRPIARWRQRRSEARRAAMPRAAGLAAVVVLMAIFLRRLHGTQRWVILAVAAVPATLFAVDGYLAVSRVWNEPVEIRTAETTAVNRTLHRFQTAVSSRDWNEARREARDAAAAGASPQPLHFVLGRLAEDLGHLPEASAEYERALEAPGEAPGAWAGLARIAFEKKSYLEAVQDWDRYLSLTAPDPMSLVLKAAALARTGDGPAAQQCLAQAIVLDPGRPEPYDLSSRIAAIQGDETTAIARLREEEKLRRIDRAALAEDPTYALLSEKAAWKAFLSEKPPEIRNVI